MSRTYELDPYGVKWMGAVPSRWSVEPAKRHFDIQLGKMLQNDPSCDTDRMVPYFKALHVLWGAVNARDLPEMWASPSELRQYGVVSGDLLVCEGGEVGRAGIVTATPRDSIIQNALHRVRGKNTGDVRFLMYVLHSVSSSGWFDVLCNRATIAHFTGEKFASLRIPLPPTDEQRAIAAFLDRETARIDALIERKRRQIELLQEKRSALISHAVTKGLDRNAKMKDSGIEWLGRIPEHWEAVRFKRCIEFITSGPRGWAEFFSDDGELFIRIGNLTRDSIDLDLADVQHVVPPTGAEAIRTRVRAGDILVSITADLGSVAVVPDQVETAYISQHIALARPMGKRGHPRWLGFSIFAESCRNQLRALGYGGTKVQLGLEDVQNLILCTPPRDEQDRIVSWLDDQFGRQSVVVQKVRNSITTLSEYRTALISAAVTGNIDVRKEVA